MSYRTFKVTNYLKVSFKYGTIKICNNDLITHDAQAYIICRSQHGKIFTNTPLICAA